MTLPASGNTISLDQIHIELGESSGSTVALGDSDVRALASDTSGAIGMNQFFGLSNITPRAIFTGGNRTSISNIIDYVNPSSGGDASDFGDLHVDYRRYHASLGSATRGVTGGGVPNEVTMERVTFASTGDGADFGDLALKKENHGACSNSTQGLFAGNELGRNADLIEKINIASDGDAATFGNLQTDKRFLAGTANPTKGFFIGGQNAAGARVNVIDKVNFSSDGNASDFGNAIAVEQHGALASATRAVYAGGYDGSSTNGISNIDYFLMASEGNKVDFGALDSRGWRLSGTGSATIGLFSGGTSRSNIISQIVIASDGNDTDFGDLTTNTSHHGSCSNVHGGIS